MTQNMRVIRVLVGMSLIAGVLSMGILLPEAIKVYCELVIKSSEVINNIWHLNYRSVSYGSIDKCQGY